MYKGVVASPGIAIGEVLLYEEEELVIPYKEIPKEETKAELNRFREALSKTRQEIIKAQNKILEVLGKEHARLLDAYLLILEDPLLTKNVSRRVLADGVNVERALSEVVEKVVKTLEAVGDEFFRERTNDILAVYQKVMHNLLGREKIKLAELDREVIIVAHNLTPADTLLLPPEKVLGFVTDVGGRTSHTAILAQSLNIPAVVGLKSITQHVQSGDTVIVDGNDGTIIVNPEPAIIENYRRTFELLLNEKKELEKLRDLPTITTDGKKIGLAANIESIEEIKTALNSGAEGIGLYRTEYLYLTSDHLPTEEEQYQNYVKAAKSVLPYYLTVRTLDLGGDKLIPKINGQEMVAIGTESNPFLGMRSIRFCLRYPDIFKTQLRAILRASAEGKIKILIPMFSSIEELIQSKRILEEVKTELREKKICFDETIKVGAMIEVPSAAITADMFAKEADFLSIGTNDLIQYTLAVDRTNENIANLYDPMNPAILRLLKNTVDAGHKEGKNVSICGDMATESSFVLVLMGMGLDELSVPAGVIPKIKKTIRELSYQTATNIINEIMSLSTTEEINNLLKKVARF